MKFFQRMKNLWALSELVPMQINERLKIGDIHTTLKKPNPLNIGFQYDGEPKAQIIKRKIDDIEEVLKQNE